jgi:hypothetical protein
MTMQAIFGFLGSIIAAIALAIAGSVAATIFVILWKSGTLDDAWGTLTAFISGAWAALGQFFGFLRELIAAAF